MQFHGVMRLHWSHIGFVDFHGSGCECRLGVAANTLNLQFPFGFEIVTKVRFFRAIDNLDSGRGGLCLFECLGNGERYILAVVINDIIFKWRTSFVEISTKGQISRRPVQPANILAMQDCHNAWHLLGIRGVKSCNSALSHCAAHRNCVDHLREIEIRSVLCVSADLERAVDTRYRCSNNGRGECVFC